MAIFNSCFDMTRGYKLWHSELCHPFGAYGELWQRSGADSGSNITSYNTMCFYCRSFNMLRWKIIMNFLFLIDDIDLPEVAIEGKREREREREKERKT